MRETAARAGRFSTFFDTNFWGRHRSISFLRDTGREYIHPSSMLALSWSHL